MLKKRKKSSSCISCMPKTWRILKSWDFNSLARNSNEHKHVVTQYRCKATWSKLTGLYNNRHFVPFAFDIAITTACCLPMHLWLRRHGRQDSVSFQWDCTHNHRHVHETQLTIIRPKANVRLTSLGGSSLCYGHWNKENTAQFNWGVRE